MNRFLTAGLLLFMAWIIVIGHDTFFYHYESLIKKDNLTFDGSIALIAFIACVGGAIATIFGGTKGDPE